MHSPAQDFQSGATAVVGNWDAFASTTILLAVLIGVGFTVVMPPFEFNDEHAHFARAYQLSLGRILPERFPTLPSGIIAVLERYPEGYSGKDAVRPKLADVFAGWTGEYTPAVPVAVSKKLKYFAWGDLVHQAYLPLCYVPASAGILIARGFALSPLGMLYAGRLASLLWYLIAFALALWLAPGFRALLAGVGLMPMVMHQAAAVSADTVTISLALVGFSLVLRLREPGTGRGALIALFVMAPIWALCKNSLWVLPVLLLVPFSRFSSRLAYIVYLAGLMAFLVAALGAWKILTNDVLEDFRKEELARGVDIYGNARALIHHPLTVLGDLTMRTDSDHLEQTFQGSGWKRRLSVLKQPLRLANFIRNRMGQFVGTFGWSFVTLPFRLIYLAMLLIVARLELSPSPFAVWERWLLTAIFVGALVQSFVTIILLDGTVVNGHYEFWSGGYRGRYALPFALAGLLALKGRRNAVSSTTLMPVVLGMASVFGAISLYTIVAFYYS
jgi:hypothetical protein